LATQKPAGICGDTISICNIHVILKLREESLEEALTTSWRSLPTSSLSARSQDILKEFLGTKAWKPPYRKR